MRIIEISVLDNGAHRNQAINGMAALPDGWAVIPEGIATENFPFGTLEVENISGVMTVTNWTSGTVPKPEPELEPGPTIDDVLNALLGVRE